MGSENVQAVGVEGYLGQAGKLCQDGGTRAVDAGMRPCALLNLVPLITAGDQLQASQLCPGPEPFPVCQNWPIQLQLFQGWKGTRQEVKGDGVPSPVITCDMQQYKGSTFQCCNLHQCDV
jgi:hypothetical protein